MKTYELNGSIYTKFDSLEEVKQYEANIQIMKIPDNEIIRDVKIKLNESYLTGLLLNDKKLIRNAKSGLSKERLYKYAISFYKLT